MMNKVLGISILALMLAGCMEKEIHQVGLSGALTGTITSYSSAYVVHPIQSGVKVTIEGSIPEVSTHTNDEGRFSFSNLKTGTYDLVFSKDGFGTHKMIGYAFVGGDEPAYVSSSICQLSSTRIAGLDLAGYKYEYSTLKVIRGSVYLDLPDVQQSVQGFLRYFLSDRSDVSPLNYIETGTLTYWSAVFEIERSINTNRFPPQTELYMVVYPCGETYLNYVDLETGTKVYSTVGPIGSNVVAIKVPSN